MIPIVDLDQKDASRVGPLLRQAFEEIGFVVVTAHGIGPPALDGIVSAARAFFALDDATKHACAPRRWNPEARNRYRGYFPSEVQGKEGLDLGDPRLVAAADALLDRPYYERNALPASLPDPWHTAVEVWFAGMTALGDRLVRAALAALDTPPRWPAHAFARPVAQSTLRFNRYPTDTALVSADPEAPTLFCEAHYDSSMLTLLHQDRQGGLQVRTRQREWIDVPFLEGAFVVNTGRALERVSDGRYPATAHRVVPTPSPRISIPFFLEPRWDAPIDGAPYEDFLTKALAVFEEYRSR